MGNGCEFQFLVEFSIGDSCEFKTLFAATMHEAIVVTKQWMKAQIQELLPPKIASRRVNFRNIRPKKNELVSEME